ncbi:hypothetical protein MRX96_005033 [Rhipicephalus microplus]
MNPKGDGTAWGVLILNSNAMDYTVTSGGNIVHCDHGRHPGPLLLRGIHTRSGGFNNTKSSSVFPSCPPIWALGYQVWMTNYTSLNEVRGAVTALDQAGLPKDMIWLDVFQDSKAFTLNSAFGGLQTYVRQLASAGVQVGLVTVRTRMCQTSIKQMVPYIEHHVV